MSVIHQRGNAVIHGNLTPMIAMTCLLIVFFVLVSRIVDRERVDMNLPQPHDAVTQRAGEDRRVVINVMPGSQGEVGGYRLGGMNFPTGRAGLAALTQHLSDLYRASPQINVNVRADRHTHSEYVEPVMQSVATAARAAGLNETARVNLVVLQDK